MTALKHSVENLYNKFIASHRSKAQQKYDFDHIQHYLQSDNHLTKDEIEQIKDRWGGMSLPLKNGYDYFHAMKSIFGFSPDFVPSSYFFPYIEGILNPIGSKRYLCHKSMTELLFSNIVKTPKTLIRSFGGVLFDSNYRTIKIKEAINILNKLDCPLLFKPATDSEQGMGIKLFKSEDIYKLTDLFRNGYINSSNQDFVIQELVEQDKDTAIFNPTSLNCMRITTLNLNGNVSIGSMALKCGPLNSVVDNIGSIDSRTKCKTLRSE